MKRRPFLTTDPSLLAQYYALRNRMYLRHYPSLPADFGKEEHLDALSQIALDCEDGYVIAGARLTLSTPQKPLQLPLEHGGFSIRQHFGHWLGNAPYGEISRYAVEPRFAQRSVSIEISAALCANALFQGVDSLFALCPPGASALNRVHARRMGVECREFHGIRVETSYGVVMELLAFTRLSEMHAEYRRAEFQQSVGASPLLETMEQAA